MAGAPELPTKLASTIREGHFVVIDNRPCKVLRVDPSRRRKHWCKFVVRDIFSRTILESPDVSPTHKVKIPDVNRSDYRVLGISGGTTLVMMNTSRTYKFFQVTNEDLLAKITARLQAVSGSKDRFLFATVLSSMGEEHICTFKAINPIFPMEN